MNTKRNAAFENAFLAEIAELTEEFRDVFETYIVAAKTEDDSAYVCAGMCHCASVIMAMTWPPNIDRKKFKRLITESFSQFLDGGLDAVERVRTSDQRVLTAALRAKREMQ